MNMANELYTPKLIIPGTQNSLSKTRLKKWFTAEIDQNNEIIGIRQFQGGMSNPTYLIELSSKVKYVLRKKPHGKLLPKAHSIDREYKVMDSIFKLGFPVPKMLKYCHDTSIVGTEFFVMNYIEGRVLSETSILKTKKHDRYKLYESMVETLGQLHRVNWRKTELKDFGKPGGYLLRQTRIWTRQYQSAKSLLALDYSDIEWLGNWLNEHVAQLDDNSIIHGDFRFGNSILHPRYPKIKAVLDWELSTIGHPLSDLSYFCLPYRQRFDDKFSPGLKGLNLKNENIPSEVEIIEQYCISTGRKEISNWPVYLAFSFFRKAAIILGVAARTAQGNVSSESADLTRDSARGLSMANLGKKIAQEFEKKLLPF